MWEAGSGDGHKFGRGVRRSLGSLGSKSLNMDAKKVAEFKKKQLETLTTFREIEASGAWRKLHSGHFDWWMFPIDDGSKAAFNVTSEADVEALRGDAEWRERYHDSVRLVAKAWGWDVATATRIEPLASGMGWTDWDVRLAKICRSLFLFEETQLLRSVQAFAREIQQVEKKGKSFFYGTICLDELLLFELPRRSGDADASPKAS